MLKDLVEKVVQTNDIVVSMPLYVETGVKKKVKRRFNLNEYRNWYHHISNEVKQLYKDLVFEQVKNIKFESKIEITFTLWKRDKRKLDRSNQLAIHEKFFCDALTEFGCIPDDNDDYIESSHYYTGGVDKANPRVDILIKVLK